MTDDHELGKLIDIQDFRFDRLKFDSIDNSSIFQRKGADLIQQEFCLFHHEVKTGKDYFAMFHNRIKESMEKRMPLPCVRFADGEYAFYRESLSCNGLYKQAESGRAIKAAMPMHIEGIRELTETGIMAPLIFPGNIIPQKHGLLSLLTKKKDNSALQFLRFLRKNGITLSKNNYIPFYTIYAYLTSTNFKSLVNGKNVCILTSEFNEKTCEHWFKEAASLPDVTFVKLPDAFVATQWRSIREKIIEQVHDDNDICLVGAGIGSLLVCVDVAREKSIPAIDAGHVINMINGQEDKSEGARLYTLRKQ